jgi:hypothetical protein
VDVLSNTQWLDYLNRLLLLTQQGKVTWEQVTDDEHVFAAEFGTTIVLISSKDKDDRHPFELALARRGGTGADVLRISSLANPENEQMSNINHQLADLYDGARRRALNIDAVIHNIFSDLEDLESE